jgi:hypothetical protein
MRPELPPSNVAPSPEGSRMNLTLRIHRFTVITFAKLALFAADLVLSLVRRHNAAWPTRALRPDDMGRLLVGRGELRRLLDALEGDTP